MYDEYAYVTMVAGPRVGTNFLLDTERPNRVGRGDDCEIMLLDPLCSRVHARLIRTEQGWMLTDAGSRNGSFVDGQRVEEVLLTEGAVLRFGSTEFIFHRSNQPPTQASVRDTGATQTVIRQTPVRGARVEDFARSQPGRSDAPHELLVLYQLATRLFACGSSDQVCHASLELLQERTGASAVALLWRQATGRFQPRLILPPRRAGDEIELSDALAQELCEQARAVWISHHGHTPVEAPQRWQGDALSVPIVLSATTVGAIHVLLEQGRFRQRDFEFAIFVGQLLAAALGRLRHELRVEAGATVLSDACGPCDQIVGQSEPTRRLNDAVCRAAASDDWAWIRGESGSGRQLAAHIIHQNSSRTDGPIRILDCSSITDNAAALDPASTATIERHGQLPLAVLASADLGTLVLRHVHQLPHSMQTWFAQRMTNPVPRGPAAWPLAANFRILATTDQDLESCVRRGVFDPLLFTALDKTRIAVPPLRQRGDDVLLLADYYLQRFQRWHGRSGLAFSEAARQTLLQYEWPGNVRQLRNTIESAVLVAAGPVIAPQDLRLGPVGELEVESLRLDQWERRLIERALRRVGGRVPDAAKLLGLGRATLYRKLEEYGIQR